MPSVWVVQVGFILLHLGMSLILLGQAVGDPVPWGVARPGDGLRDTVEKSDHRVPCGEMGGRLRKVHPSVCALGLGRVDGNLTLATQ